MRLSLGLVGVLALSVCAGPAVVACNGGEDVAPPPAPPSPTVTGRAMLVGEADSSGIEITLTGATTVRGVTDAGGNYSLPNVPPGSYTLVAVAKSTREGSKVATITVAADGAAESPTLEFTPLGELTGTVTLGKEAGNGGIVVTVPGTPAVAITDDAGKWTLPNIVTGVRDVIASYPGYASGSLKGATVKYNASTATESLVLAKAPLGVGAISGKAVLTGESDSSSIVVTVTGPTSAAAVVGTDGSYKLSGLPDGVYVVTAAAVSTAEGTRSATVAIKDGVEVAAPELAFTPLGTVTGKVTLGTSTGNAGITVLLAGTAASGTTDDAGNYTIKNVPSGSRDLIASRAGYNTGKSDGLAVKYNTSVAAPDLVLVKAKAGVGKIDGKAVLTGESDSKDIAITLSGPVSGAATTTSSGAYSFADLPDGTYTVVAVAASTLEGTKTISVEVKDGAAATAADIAFTGVGTITGKATLGSATTGNSGILVFASGGSAPVYTDDAGNYTLKNVPTTSSWTINASKTGYTTGTTTVTKVPYAATIGAAPISLSVDSTLSGSIVGKALLAGGDTHGGTTVTLNELSRTTTTTSAGDFSFTEILKGGMVSLDFVNGGLTEKLPSVLVLPGASGFIVEGSTYAMQPLEIQRAPRIFSGYPSARLVTPDNSAAIVTKWDSGLNQLWKVGIGGGDNRLLTSDTSIQILGITPDSTRLVYRNDSTRDYWSVALAGGAPVPLLKNATSGYAWITPDSKKLVHWTYDSVTGRRDFVTVDLVTGVATTLLAQFDGHHDISPDNAKFIMQKRTTSGAYEFYLVDAVAGTAKLFNPGTNFNYLRVSPNGAKVATTRYVSSTGTYQFALIDVASGTERTAPADSSSYYYAEFTRDSAYVVWYDYYSSGYSLRSMRTSDGVVTTMSSSSSEPKYHLGDAVWYTCVTTTGSTCKLTLLRPDGTRATVDPTGTTGVSSRWLSSDRTTILWESNEGSVRTLNMAAAAGGGAVVRVPNFEGISQMPVGKHLIYRAAGQYVLGSVDGSTAPQVLPWTADSVSSARFSPDGTKLGYRIVKDGKQYNAWSPVAGIATATPTIVSRGWDLAWAGNTRMLSYNGAMPAPFSFQNGIYAATTL